MKFNIAEFRSAIRMLNYIRNDFSGSTRDEQLKQNLRERYADHIANLQAMLPHVAIRFAVDIADANQALACAETQIARNEERQRQAAGEPVHPRLQNSGSITVMLPGKIQHITCNITFVDFKNKKVLN